MTQPFRIMAPKRTCTKNRANYNAYKTFLAEDFNHRCGFIGLVENVLSK